MNAAGNIRACVIDKQTADEYICAPIDVLGCTHLAVYVLGLGTTSGGVITIEEACWDPLTQVDRATTWVAVGTMNASDSSAGVMKVTHLTVGAYSHMRVRISTAISGGGTISAWLVGAP